MSGVQVQEVSRAQLEMWEYHILMALGAGERHAEQLVRNVERLSAGKLRLERRVVEALVRRLVRAGFVVAIGRRGNDEEGSELVHYGLTRPGEVRLAHETCELTALLANTQSPAGEIILE